MFDDPLAGKMQDAQPVAIAANLQPPAVHLAGADLRATIGALGLGDLGKLNIFPGGQVISTSVGAAAINNDPTAASPIIVHIEATPAAQTQTQAALSPDGQQRLALLAMLRRFARIDPALARDPNFWNAIASAERGRVLTPAQWRMLQSAWMKRAQRFNATTPRQQGQLGRDTRAFTRSMTERGYKYYREVVTMVPGRIVGYDRIVTLGEDFEGAVFERHFPDPTPKPRVALSPEPIMGMQPEPHGRRRKLETADGALTAAEFAARPQFNPKLTPHFTDTDSGDDG